MTTSVGDCYKHVELQLNRKGSAVDCRQFDWRYHKAVGVGRTVGRKGEREGKVMRKGRGKRREAEGNDPIPTAFWTNQTLLALQTGSAVKNSNCQKSKMALSVIIFRK